MNNKYIELEIERIQQLFSMLFRNEIDKDKIELLKYKLMQLYKFLDNIDKENK